MLILLLTSIILGGIVAGVTGIGFLFWVVSILLFICGLPFTLINGFIQDKIDYVQDREDYRQIMREINEDERLERYIESIDERDEPDIYIDNRQINLYNIDKYNNNEQKDYDEPIIKSKKRKSRFDG